MAKHMSGIVELCLHSNPQTFNLSQLFLLHSHSLMLHSNQVLKLFGFRGLEYYIKLVNDKMRSLFEYYLGYIDMWDDVMFNVFQIIEANVSSYKNGKNRSLSYCNKFYLLLDMLCNINADENPKTLILVKDPLVAYLIKEFLKAHKFVNMNGYAISVSIGMCCKVPTANEYMPVPPHRAGINLEFFYNELNRVIMGTHLINQSQSELDYEEQEFSLKTRSSIFVSTYFNPELKLGAKDKILVFDNNEFKYCYFSSSVMNKHINVMFVRDQTEETKRKIGKLDEIVKMSHRIKNKRCSTIEDSKGNRKTEKPK